MGWLHGNIPSERDSSLKMWNTTKELCFKKETLMVGELALSSLLMFEEAFLQPSCEEEGNRVQMRVEEQASILISVSRLKPHDSSFHQGEQHGPGCPEARTGPAHWSCVWRLWLPPGGDRLLLFWLVCVFQELEKPSPPQKPLPADPRSSRLVRSPSAVQGRSLAHGPSVVCGPPPVPRVPTPARPVSHPLRWGLLVARFISDTTLIMLFPLSTLF